jgi:hypothetical protein
MSTSQIPNLLAARGGPRSRGRGRGRGRGGSSQLSAASRRDQTIQATDTDAAVSRLSAVSLGYLDDPFAQSFVNGQGTRRLPIINRGSCIQILYQTSVLIPPSRNIHSHQRPRHPHQRLPFLPLPNTRIKTNNIPRRRNRYTVFPSASPKPPSQCHLPRIRFPRRLRCKMPYSRIQSSLIPR